MTAPNGADEWSQWLHPDDDQDEFTELVNADLSRVDLVGAAANGTGVLIAKAGARVSAPVVKAVPERRYLLAVAYQAGRDPLITKGADGARDFMSADELERAAWSFVVKGGQAGMFHMMGTEGHAQIVESYLYRGPDWTVTGPTGRSTVVKAGDWLVGLILGEAAWALYKAGRIGGLSPQGTGTRRRVIAKESTMASTSTARRGPVRKAPTDQPATQAAAGRSLDPGIDWAQWSTPDLQLAASLGLPQLAAGAKAELAKRGRSVTVGKAKAKPEPQIPVYDADGKLVGLCDPDDLLPVADGQAKPKPAAIDPAQTDLTPTPSAQVGVPADAARDVEVAKVAKGLLRRPGVRNSQEASVVAAAIVTVARARAAEGATEWGEVADFKKWGVDIIRKHAHAQMHDQLRRLRAPRGR